MKSSCPQGDAALTARVCLDPQRLPLTSEVVDEAPQGIATESPAPIKRKSKGKSPTARSLEHWRALGYLCAVVERRLPRGFVTQDMYGFIDILAIKDEDIVGIQTTAQAVANRVRKITEHENYAVVARAMRIVVEGWRKNAKGRWVRREIEL